MERKFLEGLGITDKATIDAIMDQNGAEVSTLNTRIKTKDTEISTLRTDLAEANNTVADLSQVDVETLQKQLQDEKDARIADKKAWSLNAVLTNAGCTDADYITYKISKDVEYNEDGTVKDAENFVKDVAEKYPNQFKAVANDDDDDNNKGTGSTGNFGRDHSTKTPASKNPYSKEGWNMTEQMNLEINKPEVAKKLKAEAEV